MMVRNSPRTARVHFARYTDTNSSRRSLGPETSIRHTAILLKSDSLHGYFQRMRTSSLRALLMHPFFRAFSGHTLPRRLTHHNGLHQIHNQHWVLEITAGVNQVHCNEAIVTDNQIVAAHKAARSNRLYKPVSKPHFPKPYQLIPIPRPRPYSQQHTLAGTLKNKQTKTEGAATQSLPICEAMHPNHQPAL